MLIIVDPGHEEPGKLCEAHQCVGLDQAVVELVKDGVNRTEPDLRNL